MNVVNDAKICISNNITIYEKAIKKKIQTFYKVNKPL
jgi:hypothetical protein